MHYAIYELFSGIVKFIETSMGYLILLKQNKP